MKFIAYTTANPPGLLKRIVMFVSTAALAVLALMFSALLLALILIVGASVIAYLWWKTRKLRKQLRSQMPDFPPRGATAEQEEFAGEVIEGEVIRVERSGDEIKR